jgi:NADPH-dependent 2,4-dienoyl-CoA reductase/sulfur reductase-like enzyme/rhodanese-related sulfurtransferase
MASKLPVRIVIVGGVAGGMSAATRARRLDEKAIITVFEKGPYVSFANCGLPYALGGIIKDEAVLILQTPRSFKERFNIDVYENKEVVNINRTQKFIDVRTMGTDMLSQYSYDKLILAQGAEPFAPPIIGITSPNVFTLQTIPDLQRIKSYISNNSVKDVAIIGGGFIGIEVVDALRQMSLHVSVLEYTSHIFPLLDADITEPLHKELGLNCVNLVLNARVKSIAPASGAIQGHVILADHEPIPADLVIVSVGIRARTTLAKQAGLVVSSTGVKVNEFMQTSDSDIYAVGDMVETEHRVAERPLSVALAGLANRQGRLAADNIFGRAMSYRGNVGTSACKVFGLTVASTGLSVHALRKMGKNPQWVTVHPPDHAAYYPGSHTITLKVVFDPITGKLLGAQAVGVAGVDKRIDVLSTAIQANSTVFDLEHLELAYAPPYSSAKDPVNMAGFVGSNVMRGDVEIVHAEDLSPAELEDRRIQIVDVRSGGEYARGHVKGAVNLPINELRGLIGQLDAKMRVVVYCQVGYRGYLGYRILKQRGFDVVNLDGGFKTVVDGGFTELQEDMV